MPENDLAHLSKEIVLPCDIDDSKFIFVKAYFIESRRRAAPNIV
jgi:hypothetical protein